MADDALQEIREAVDGLLYPSESDEPFEVDVWPGGPTDARGQVVSHAITGSRIDAVGADEFFDALKDSDDADRFDALQRTLQDDLADLAVFRVGDKSATVRVFILGRLPDGRWLILKTKSVET